MLMKAMKIQQDFESSAVNTHITKVKNVMSRVKFGPFLMQYIEIFEKYHLYTHEKADFPGGV